MKNRLYILCFIAFCVPCAASILYIPSDYNSIQEGVNASNEGDTILVEIGTYVENITLNHAVVLTSNYIFDQDSNTINTTIIDGDSITSVITIPFGLKGMPIVQFLTIRNGGGNNGGGLLLSSFCYIRGNIIEDNHVTDGYGGGIRATSDSAYIFQNIIRNNSARDVSVSFASGGGIYAGSQSKIVQNHIYGNYASSRGGGVGGSDYHLRNNWIYGNTCPTRGAGVQVNIGETWIYNNIIYKNFGNGIYTWSTSPDYGIIVHIENCTIFGNSSYCLQSSGRLETIIKNSIFYENGVAEIDTFSKAIVTMSYSNLPGGWGGINNTDVDPLFADTMNNDYHLLSGSSLIDAGNPDEQYNDICFPPAQGTVTNDMGAYGGPWACGWSDSTLLITSLNQSKSVRSVISDFRLVQNYPNPFNATTSIIYQIRKQSLVKLVIYDLLGRNIRVLVDEIKRPGVHRVIWDGKDEHEEIVASGIYIYEMRTADAAMRKKLVMIK